MTDWTDINEADISPTRPLMKNISALSTSTNFNFMSPAPTNDDQEGSKEGSKEAKDTTIPPGVGVGVVPEALLRLHPLPLPLSKPDTPDLQLPTEDSCASSVLGTDHSPPKRSNSYMNPSVQIRRLSENFERDHNTIAQAMITFKQNDALRAKIEQLESKNEFLVGKMNQNAKESVMTENMLTLRVKERSLLLQELTQRVRDLRQQLQEARLGGIKTRGNMADNPFKPNPNPNPNPFKESSLSLPKLGVCDLNKSLSEANIKAYTAKKEGVVKERSYKGHPESRHYNTMTPAIKEHVDKAHEIRTMNSAFEELSDEKILELKKIRTQIEELSKTEFFSTLSSPNKRRVFVRMRDDSSKNGHDT